MLTISFLPTSVSQNHNKSTTIGTPASRLIDPVIPALVSDIFLKIPIAFFIQVKGLAIDWRIGRDW
jgi:hypothetical protein